MKTPEEKALEIGAKMYKGDPWSRLWSGNLSDHLLEVDNAKRCALIAVNEMIEFEANYHSNLSKVYDYLLEVKTELENL